MPIQPWWAVCGVEANGVGPWGLPPTPKRDDAGGPQRDRLCTPSSNVGIGKRDDLAIDDVGKFHGEGGCRTAFRFIWTTSRTGDVQFRGESQPIAGARWPRYRLVLLLE